MYPYAETAADVSHVAVPVDARQQSEAVYYQAVGLANALLRGLGIAHGGAAQLADDLAYMVVADDVRRDYELPVTVVVEILDEDVLVRRPTAARHKHLAVLLESLYQGQFLGLTLDLQHAVEACVTRYLNVGDAERGKQTLALVVLDEEACEAFQHPAVRTPVPTEEHLTLTEDAADAVNGHATPLEDVQVVPPKLILYEESHLRMHEVEELARAEIRVQGQVTDDVRALVVLPHLIT